MRRFLLHIVPLLLLAACGREPEPVKPADTRRLSLGVTEVAADPEGGAFEIAVDANFEYAVRTEADWISEDGGTPALRRFRSERNPYASPRSATLRFVDVSDRYFFKEVTVTQGVPTSDKVTLSIVDKEATPKRRRCSPGSGPSRTRAGCSATTTTSGMAATGTMSPADRTRRPSAGTIPAFSASILPKSWTPATTMRRMPSGAG